MSAAEGGQDAVTLTRADLTGLSPAATYQAVLGAMRERLPVEDRWLVTELDFAVGDRLLDASEGAPA